MSLHFFSIHAKLHDTNISRSLFMKRLREIFVNICMIFKIVDHRVHSPIFFGNPMFPYQDQFVLVPIILW